MAHWINLFALWCRKIMTKRQYEEQRPLVKETEHNGTVQKGKGNSRPNGSLEWVLVLFSLHIVPPPQSPPLAQNSFPFLAALQFKRK
jgi:hypothetical protein